VVHYVFLAAGQVMETHLIAIAGGRGIGEDMAAVAFGVIMLFNGFGIAGSGE